MDNLISQPASQALANTIQLMADEQHEQDNIMTNRRKEIMSLTHIGQLREDYAIAARIEDPRPSRFDNNGEDYRAWSERADRAQMWACCTSNIAPAQCLHYRRA